MPLQYLESSLFEEEDAIKTSSAQASLKMNWPPELIDAEDGPPLPPDSVALSFEDDENADKKPAASNNNDSRMPLQQLEATFEEEEAVNQTAAAAAEGAARIDMDVSQEDHDAPVPPQCYQDFLDEDDKFYKKAASNESKTPASASSTASASSQNQEAQSSTLLPSNTPSQSSPQLPSIAPSQRLPPLPLSNAAPPLAPSPPTSPPPLSNAAPPPLAPPPPTPPSEPTFYAVEATLVPQESEAVVINVQQSSAPVYDAVLVPDQGSPPVLVPSRAKYKRFIFTGMAATVGRLWTPIFCFPSLT